MDTTISDLKIRLQSKIHGSSLNKVQDVYNLIFEGTCNFLSRVDPTETIRSSQISNAIYDQVYNYSAPTDLKNNKIIDIRQQVNRTAKDNFTNVYSEEFDRNKFNNNFSVELVNGVKSLRISKTIYTGVTVNEMNTTTENGTWTATANAQNLTSDTFNKVSGSGSLRFDLSASGSAGYIENSTMNAVDLSSIKNNGAIFMYVWIPNSNITSVSLRWGSSSADYYSVTVTSTNDNTAFVTGWNLLRFDWFDLTPTGTPVDTAINYARVTFAYNGTATASCRVDNIVARRGTIHNALYYSKYLFRSSAGTWKERPTSDDDTINLEMDGVNCLLYEIGFLIAQELQGEDSSFDTEFTKAKKDEVWRTYMEDHKSQFKKPVTPYYRTRIIRRR